MYLRASTRTPRSLLEYIYALSPMQIQTFMASALLLSGLSSAVILPRDEVAQCIPNGGICRYTQADDVPCCPVPESEGTVTCLPGGPGIGVRVQYYIRPPAHSTLVRSFVV